MADEIQNDFAKAKATLQADIAVLDTAASKVKVFWADYKFYLVAFVIAVIGLIAGYHMHVCAVCK